MHHRIVLPSGCSKPTETEAHTVASTAGHVAVHVLVSRGSSSASRPPPAFKSLRQVLLKAVEAAAPERPPETPFTVEDWNRLLSCQAALPECGPCWP